MEMWNAGDATERNLSGKGAKPYVQPP
ncbi:hypothetical protein KL86PLE_60529 [uncultured Pleomorphomonas sp.]|uniref:Uncharacterized protein n=1 Tax=uncultured Pleomorphomonas sp. TaxID=442121 RepID=A0A212LL03_9HYPH|nr:hypothetical protein KL86PLE_60529 [uncultured Pleomorphomonas sp.]